MQLRFSANPSSLWMITSSVRRPDLCSGKLLVLLGIVIVILAACGSAEPEGPSEGARSDESIQPAMANASAIGLGLEITSSEQLCAALRTAVNDGTFGQPLTSTDVNDYKPGQSANETFVLCELATEPIEVSSHPSGGGGLQPALVELNMSAPYLVGGEPSHHPSDWFLDGGRAGCHGEDDSQLGTRAATIWCSGPQKTAAGSTVMYFNDLILTFDMQAPFLMTTSFTYDKFLAAREAVFDALVLR